MNSLIQAPIKSGSRVLVRCDLDVLNEQGAVKDTFRLESALPTLSYIQSVGAIPVIAGHIGRPHGKINPLLSTNTLSVFFKKHLKPSYELLENLRFDTREETNDMAFAKTLVKNIDFYVNESFANCHREAASIVAVTTLISSFAGLRLQLEVETAEKLLKNPKHLFVTIVGGAKIESKRPVINKLAELADAVLIGGKIALEETVEGPNIYNPLDYIDTKDIGPKTIKAFKELLSPATTILWTGPLGAFEEEKYTNGTKEIAHFIANKTQQVICSEDEQTKEKTLANCFSVAGGGDTADALIKYGLEKNFSFISTGGGSLLELIAKGNIPGLKALGYQGIYV